MKQLAHEPRSGGPRVLEVPEPAPLPGCVLVRTSRSVVSPGSERNAAVSGVAGALRSVRERPDLIRRVLDTARRDGVRAAAERVRARLETTRPLGSSSAGVVIATGEGCGDRFRPGDRVACTGTGHAVHAEVACVPARLVVPVPDGVSLEHAAFGTLGAIALHGVRQAAPQLGERIGVIGLGLIGQLCAQLLRAHGARVAAFDLDEGRAAIARACGAELAHSGDADAFVRAALAWSEGVGLDAVVVAAQSSDAAPMVAAARACRERGRVVAVGLVPFELPRELAYEKELDLRISRSSGPGRHDPSYEEGGIDYPLPHVRWTEERNLEAFLGLVADGRVTLAPLVTRRLSIDRAAEAFADGEGPRPLGIVIEYPADAPPGPREVRVRPAAAAGPGLGVALIGAGQFARGVLVPELARIPGVRLHRVVTASGLSAADAARAHGFEIAGTDAEAAILDPAVELVVIATRHDAHAALVARALRAGKSVFVEKPLALTEAEIDDVEAALAGARGLLMVGFNRRWSSLAQEARRALAGRGPVAIDVRVAAPRLPSGHWLLDPLRGGGRLLGEGCHFLDLCSFLAGDPPIESADAVPVGRPAATAEDFLLRVRFADGSAGQVLYTTQADPRLAKERIEAHAGGTTVTIDDFRKATVASGRAREGTGDGKGHAAEMRELVRCAREGAWPVPPEVVLRVARATVRAQASLSGR